MLNNFSSRVQARRLSLRRTKNFGRKSLNEIKEILANMGLSLGMRIDAHGRLIAPQLSAGGVTDYGPEGDQDQLGE